MKKSWTQPRATIAATGLAKVSSAATPYNVCARTRRRRTNRIAGPRCGSMRWAPAWATTHASVAPRAARFSQYRTTASGTWTWSASTDAVNGSVVTKNRNPSTAQASVRSDRSHRSSTVCSASQKVPSMVKLRTYAAKLGPRSPSCDASWWLSWAFTSGRWTSRTSSVIATANTPSASAWTRSTRLPDNWL
jgi:hypothetical protein